MAKTMARGLFVVLEGADGTGKTTQANRLSSMLNDNGHSCINMRFPDRTTEIGRMINQYLSCKADLSDECIHLLFSANRWELRNKIISTLKQGTSIVCDRYAFSGVAYTSSKPGFSLSWCSTPDRHLPKPDLIIYLQAPQNVIKLREDYGTERYEKSEFQLKVSKRFEEIRNMDPSLLWKEYRVVGGIDEVSKDLYKIVEDSISKLSESGDTEVGKLWECL